MVKIIPTNRKTVPTVEKWFLPLKNRSFRPPNDPYRHRTVHTVAEWLVPTAERFVPPPNGLYGLPNGSYHRRTACTDRRTIRTIAEWLVPIAEWFVPLKRMGTG